MLTKKGASDPVELLKMANDVLALVRKDRKQDLPDSPETRKAARRQCKRAKQALLRM